MAMIDEEDCNCPPEGLPAYMGTFADLMSLLMCFFVLLLAFSEMDVMKFKQLAGSMKYAFGVQNKVNVKDIPKGTSIIAKEFSPGKPTPTVITSVMQHTVDMTLQTLDFDEPSDDKPDEGEGTKRNKGVGESANVGDGESQGVGEATNLGDGSQEGKGESTSKAEALAKKIAQIMAEQLANGQIELMAQGKIVVIRIRETGSFRSGSDRIERTFNPVLEKIALLLKETEGEVRVAGHTDDVPIDTERFRSNWELSGGRAGSVVRELLKYEHLKADRFVITGYADTKPIGDNKTEAGRAKNRRVEIIIIQGDTTESKILGVSGDDVPVVDNKEPKEKEK